MRESLSLSTEGRTLLGWGTAASTIPLVGLSEWIRREARRVKAHICRIRTRERGPEWLLLLLRWNEVRGGSTVGVWLRKVRSRGLEDWVEGAAKNLLIALVRPFRPVGVSVGRSGRRRLVAIGVEVHKLGV